MTKKMKHKQLDIAQLLLKFNDEERTFEGYASKFNGLDSYGDSIVPGAYKNTLENRPRPIRMRWNHYGPVIGKWVEIKEDDEGLYVKGQLTPGHSVAEDVYASLKHGAVDGMSIGYYVNDEETKDGVNYLKDIELVEISVVEEPADSQALVSGVKSEAFKKALDEATSYKEVEKALRDVGLSGSAATALTSRIKAITLGDREREAEELGDLVDRIKGIDIQTNRSKGDKDE